MSRKQFSEENLDMLKANQENFFSRIITGGETCVRRHDPETKQDSVQWKRQGIPYTQEISCATTSWKYGNSYFGTQKVFCFWNSCHDRRGMEDGRL